MIRPALLVAWLALAAGLATPVPVLGGDLDGDGVPDAVDNCPAVSNPDQADFDLPPATVYPFDLALDADGNPASAGEYLNDDVLLAPDRQVRFEHTGQTWALIDGSGVLRIERDAWSGHLDHNLYFVHQLPLPEAFTLNVEDLWRTYPYSGITLELSVVAAPAAGGPPRLLDMASGLQRFMVQPDMYWPPDRLVFVMIYRDTGGILHFWWNDRWVTFGTGTTAIASGFHADLDLLYELIKDPLGYRGRVTRLDTGQVVLETAPVPAGDVVASDRAAYAVLGTHSWWIGRPYLTELDNWTIRPGSDGGDVCDLCPAAYDPDQRDADGDGVGDACDRCPAELPESDADADGCTDRLADLPAVVTALGLPPDTEAALLASVTAVQRSLERGNERAAVNQLRALVHKIEAQRGKAIPEADADMLLAYVAYLIATISA